VSREPIANIVSWTPRVFLVPEFLTPFETSRFQAEAASHLRRSTVSDPSEHGDVLDARRTSSTAHLDEGRAEVQTVSRRVARLVMLPREHGEPFQVARYEPGQEYVPHFDFFDPDQTGLAAQIGKAGQRVATVLIYLQAPASGGATVFPHAELSIAPQAGAALVFWNVTPDGNVDALSLHGSAPVEAGEKWIATKWIRERPWPSGGYG
jgi:prolyl 4-hydroxylase